jgi:(p)ppGpp synthase/HD superfamily hydrolase
MKPMELSPPTFSDVMDRFDARPAPAPEGRHPGFVVLGPRFDEALLYVSAAHREQPRKGTPIPYLSHLLGVAAIVLTYGGGENQAIAALLHDTVEDCGNEHEPVIGELFGDEVLAIVLHCTDSSVRQGETKAAWRGRKERYLGHLRELAPGDPALLVACADKLHNAQAIVAELETVGLPLWERFPGKAPEDHLWYYTELTGIFQERFPGPLADRLAATADAMVDLQRRLTTGAAGPRR